jgi:tellurite resistance protein TehA-like permease
MSVNFKQLVKNFAPPWFAAVMGTGVLALGTAFLGRAFPPLALLAGVLHWFNVALFLVLLLPWSLRWFQARQQAMGALAHPVASNFVPAIAIALLVLAAQFVQIDKARQIALHGNSPLSINDRGFM